MPPLREAPPAVDPRAVYQTSWWEYVRDPDGGIEMSPFVDGVASPLLRSLVSGEVRRARDLPIGALYELDRTGAAGPDTYPPAGTDGRAIACRMAGHTWHIEGRASNCTDKRDHKHRCWVRHGTVGELLTVDKNGLTCQAGAGSVFMGRENEWHGFLRGGKLTP